MAKELRQFQCQREGDIFYFQHDEPGSWLHLVSFCPVCGSKRVKETGRRYPGVNETAPRSGDRRSRRASRR